MTSRGFIPLLHLSPLNPPPGDWIMVVLKGYFDDSGDEEDRQHKACSLSGYIGTFDDWANFEKEWQKVLNDFEVPYLHMKEYAHFRGPFDKYKNNHIKRKNLLISLITVIRESNLLGISSSIRLKGLYRLNNERNIQIEAYPLNLYINMMRICFKFKTPIHLTLDKTNRVNDKIRIARNYAQTDLIYPNCDKQIMILPLNSCLTFREVLPLQAADLLAWECRKDAVVKDEWIQERPNRDDDLVTFLYHKPYEKKIINCHFQEYP